MAHKGTVILYQQLFRYEYTTQALSWRLPIRRWRCASWYVAGQIKSSNGSAAQGVAGVELWLKS